MNVLEHYQIAGTSSNLIARSIEDGIRIGRIPTGQHLPPIRALAARLGVSPATAAAAYRTLRVRGLIRGSGRRGTVVNPRPALATPAPLCAYYYNASRLKAAGVPARHAVWGSSPPPPSTRPRDEHRAIIRGSVKTVLFSAAGMPVRD